MAHTLILGTTESGKTTLAKRIASQHRARGFELLVLDPLPNRQDFVAIELFCGARDQSVLLGKIFRRKDLIGTPPLNQEPSTGNALLFR